MTRPPRRAYLYALVIASLVAPWLHPASLGIAAGQFVVDYVSALVTAWCLLLVLQRIER